jgi:hypothetical protein
MILCRLFLKAELTQQNRYLRSISVFTILCKTNIEYNSIKLYSLFIFTSGYIFQSLRLLYNKKFKAITVIKYYKTCVYPGVWESYICVNYLQYVAEEMNIIYLLTPRHYSPDGQKPP